MERRFEIETFEVMQYIYIRSRNAEYILKFLVHAAYQ